MQDVRIVKASAGTGKTFRLSLEFIRILIENKNEVNWNEILTITFTKKATAEIRERIFEHIENIIFQNEDGKMLCRIFQELFHISINDKEKKFLEKIYREMKLNKRQLQISTIDSFIQHIFKTIISPYLGIQKYDINEKINDKYFSELFNEVLKLEDEVFPFFEQNEHFIPEHFASFVNSLLQRRWLFAKMLDQGIDKEDNTEVRIRLKALLDAQMETFAAGIAESLKKNNATLNDVLKASFKEKAKHFVDLNSENVAGHIMSLFTSDEFLLTAITPLYKEDFWNSTKVNKEAKSVLSDTWFEIKKTITKYLYYSFVLEEQKQIITMLSSLYHKYDEIKFKEKIFTYDDIAYYTHRYLYDEEISMIDGSVVTNQFYEFLTRRTKFLLIDEFQDTSVIQWQILNPIIQDVISGHSLHDASGVVIVGDEKQSIYRWRGGERNLFVNLDKILNTENVSKLNTSYRSNPIIIDFVNTIFSKKMTKSFFEDKHIDWEYNPVHCKKEDDSGYISFVMQNCQNVKKEKTEATKLLYDYIQEEIIPQIKNGFLDPSKTAVLARTNKDLVTTAQAFEDAKIRYTLESSNNLFSHRAIYPILSFLRFLLHKSTYDLGVFLRSDFIRIYPDVLYNIQFSEFNESGNLAAFFTANTEIEELRRVQQLTTLHFYTVYEWLQVYLNESKWLCFYPTQNDAKNIQLLLDIAKKFDEENHEFTKNLPGFLHYIEDLNDSEIMKQSSIEEEKAVSLLTVHKSKGLEFENVIFIWNGFGRKGYFGNKLEAYYEYDENFIQHEKNVFTYKFKKVIENSELGSLVENEKLQAMIEELNVLYVALTRPVKNLSIWTSYDRVLKGNLYETLKKNLNNGSVSEWFAAALLHFFGGMNVVTPTYIKNEKGMLLAYKREEHREKNAICCLHWNETRLEKNEETVSKPITLILEENEKKMHGIIVHYFLSQVKNIDEIDFAVSQTKQNYGSMVEQETFTKLLAKTMQFVEQNQYIYSSKWDLIFNEYPIYEKKKEFRLDRLQIDHKSELILIVDYKTGKIYNDDQLENYKQILSRNLGPKYKTYKIETNYVSVAIS